MIEAILLDIEGTTTPIDFVHKTLFPFARERMGAFVSENFQALSPEVEMLVAEAAADPGYEGSLNIDDPVPVAKYLCHLIDIDRKSTPLKSIQGKIWEQGYLSGELLSVVYDDVPPAFSRWHAAGRKIAIYSSGSVLAQKLLFRYTNHGDLTPMIDAYFDTTTGNKRESASYVSIAAAIGVESATVLFVSDIPAELDAAAAFGMRTALSVRPGNPPVAGTPHRAVHSFDELE